MYDPCEHCGFDTEEHCKDCLLGILEMESEKHSKAMNDPGRVEKAAKTMHTFLSDSGLTWEERSKEVHKLWLYAAKDVLEAADKE